MLFAGLLGHWEHKGPAKIPAKRVQTFAIGEELFWGFDTTDMLLDYLVDGEMMASGEMQRLADLPSAATRKF